MHLLKRSPLYNGLCLFLASIMSLGTLAQDMNTPLPTDPNVIKGKFANGLTYYIRTNHKPEKKVELRLVINAGSILEDDDQQGLAHFMEHMDFNGTTHFQKNDLVSYLQSIGVQFGADLNANTGFDRTMYILPIPTDNPDNIEKGFQIIEDWAHNALLTDSDIDGERNVVLEEARLRKGASMRMFKQYFPREMLGSKYADRLPIGKEDILKNFKYESIRRFYHDWYRPDLMAVVVVGDIDKDAAFKLVKEHFEGLKNPENEKTRVYADVKSRQKEEAMVLTDKEATNGNFSLKYNYTKAKETKTLSDYGDELKRSIILDMFNTRLQDQAQGSTPPFTAAFAYFDNQVHGYESFTLAAIFGKGNAQKAIYGLCAEMVRAKQYGFLQSELDNAKKDMMSNVEKSYNERMKTNSRRYVEEYAGNFMNNEPIPGIENEYNYYKKLIPTITLSELNALVKTWMNDPNTFDLITAPEGDNALPDDHNLKMMVAKGLAQQVKPVEEKKIATSLMEKRPTPGKVTATTRDVDLNTTTYTLSNGIKVTIKPTTFSDDEILVRGIKQGGTGNYGLADRNNITYATSVVRSMGVGSFSPSDLEKVTSGKNIRVQLMNSSVSDIIQGSTTVKDFETMLQLLHLYITDPRKDDGLFKAFIEKQKAAIQNMMSNPQMAYQDTTMKTLFNNNPLVTAIPKMSDFDKLNLDRILEIYKNEFGTADGYNFYFIGNIDMKTALPLIESYLGSIPAANKTVAYKDDGVRPISGQNKLALKKGKEKQSMITGYFYGTTVYSEDLALKAQAVSDILNIKVVEVLREKMGGIYSGGFSAAVSKEPYERYQFSLRLPCGPENVDKLIVAAKEEIEKIKQNGPSAADLEKVKSQMIEKYKTSVKENSYWADKCMNIMFWGRNKDNVLKYEDWVSKLTPADIQATARQLFDGKNEFYSVLYPEPEGSETERGSGN